MRATWLAFLLPTKCGGRVEARGP